jgi:hypothetical protein
MVDDACKIDACTMNTCKIDVCTMDACKIDACKGGSRWQDRREKKDEGGYRRSWGIMGYHGGPWRHGGYSVRFQLTHFASVWTSASSSRLGSEVDTTSQAQRTHAKALTSTHTRTPGCWIEGHRNERRRCAAIIKGCTRCSARRVLYL